MSNYEMPIAIRLNQEELANVLGKPVDHPDVVRMGGLNVVMHATTSLHAKGVSSELEQSHADAADALSGLHKLLAPLEESLFQHLRSNPKMGKDFLCDPIGTMERLGLMDAATRTNLEIHQRVLVSHLSLKVQ